MLKTAAAPRLALLPHPQTASDAVRRIAACADRLTADTLRLQYVLEADLARVLVPAQLPGGGGREDRLWAHTCFEAFVAVAGQPGYLELNFSPSGQWAAYRFDAYRAGMAPAALLEPPQIEIQRGPRQVQLQARVRMPLAGEWRLALSAVVEGETGGLSYWALRHAPGRPDFHHPESFTLALEPPNSTSES